MNEARLEELQSLWNEFFSLPFPKQPKSEPLRDLWIDLVKHDGFQAGIISSTLNGTRVKKEEWLKELTAFDNKLASLMPEEPQAYAYWSSIEKYYSKLRHMMDIVRELYEEGF
jgi:hypothetical protein